MTLSDTSTPAPTITTFAPASGPVGTSVTITGTNLTGATAVMFNGTSASSFHVLSSTSLMATVPTMAATGPSVTVRRNGNKQFLLHGTRSHELPAVDSALMSF